MTSLMTTPTPERLAALIEQLTPDEVAFLVALDLEEDGVQLAARLSAEEQRLATRLERRGLCDRITVRDERNHPAVLFERNATVTEALNTWLAVRDEQPEQTTAANRPRRMVVTVPASEAHMGRASITGEILTTCPVCDGPRGDVYPGFSYDGSLRLGVDCWQNPCGHVDRYPAVRQEIAELRAQDAQQAEIQAEMDAAQVAQQQQAAAAVVYAAYQREQDEVAAREYVVTLHYDQFPILGSRVVWEGRGFWVAAEWAQSAAKSLLTGRGGVRHGYVEHTADNATYSAYTPDYAKHGQVYLLAGHVTVETRDAQVEAPATAR